MKRKVTILIIISVLVVILSGCTEQKTMIGDEKGTEGGIGPDWCKTGTKLSVKVGNASSFIIKGITEHNGTEVCEASIDSVSGSIVQYFNEKYDYIVIVYKDQNGKVVQEVNINNSNTNNSNTNNSNTNNYNTNNSNTNNSNTNNSNTNNSNTNNSNTNNSKERD